MLPLLEILEETEVSTKSKIDPSSIIASLIAVRFSSEVDTGASLSQC